MVYDLPAGKIARRRLVDVDENTSVLEAAGRMAQENRGSVMVTRAGERVGILTERDLLSARAHVIYPEPSETFGG